MRSSKVIFAVAAALALGSAVTIAAHAEPRMVPVSATIRAMLDDLRSATQKEIASGCVEKDGRGGTRLCGDSKTRIDALHDDAARDADALIARPPERRQQALRAIRAFRNDDSLALTYHATSGNPYMDGANIEIYADDRGNEYWIDPAADALVQMGPDAGADPTPHQTGPEARLPVARLREIAIGIAASQIPDFAARRSSFHPLEDNKNRAVYFFRWDDFSRPAKESDMPPFIQIALFADGTIASFTNTLTTH